MALRSFRPDSSSPSRESCGTVAGAWRLNRVVSITNLEARRTDTPESVHLVWWNARSVVL